MEDSARWVRVVAALALLSPAALDGCGQARAQSAPRSARRAPRPPRSGPDAGLRADASGSPDATSATRPDGCPASIYGIEGQRCTLPESARCFSGMTSCRCTRGDGGAAWRCETAFLGPLPPPDLAV